LATSACSSSRSMLRRRQTAWMAASCRDVTRSSGSGARSRGRLGPFPQRVEFLTERPG
jgi:hypothetical protein